MKNFFCPNHALLRVEECLPLGIYLTMETANDVLDGFVFRLKDRGRIHFILGMSEFCLADQATVLRLVNDVIKDRFPSAAEATMTNLSSNNPGLLDGIDRIPSDDVINRVADV